MDDPKCRTRTKTRSLPGFWMQGTPKSSPSGGDSSGPSVAVNMKVESGAIVLPTEPGSRAPSTLGGGHLCRCGRVIRET